MFSIFGVVFVAEAQGLIPCSGSDCTFDKLIDLIQNVIDFLLVTVAIPLATILFAYAGWLYMSAAGDSTKIARGHQIFRNVLFGLVIALAAWLIINTLTSALISDKFPREFLFLRK